MQHWFRERLFDERLEFLEFPCAGPFEPLEQDHLAIDDVDAGLEQSRQRKLSACFGARADRIGDHERFETLLFEIDCGLSDADVSLNAADYDLGPSLTAQLMQAVTQRIALQAGELDLVHDEAGIGESVADRVCRRPKPLRVLLRHGYRQAERSCRAHQPDAAVDHAVLSGDRLDELLLNVDYEEL